MTEGVTLVETLPRALYDLTLDELEDQIQSWGEPRYRAEQIFDWVYQRDVGDFQVMTNLPAELRTRLTEHFSLQLPPVVETLEDDEAIRSTYELFDGTFVESVYIKTEEQGSTFCLSTQVGCDLSCFFCASSQTPQG